MEASHAGERITAEAERAAAEKTSLIVVVVPVRDEADDDCAGGIVRFSLGSDGH
jgi:hypothetical protein